jgi:hypothetical protein
LVLVWWPKEIASVLQQIGTHHSGHCFGKTPMQTLRGVVHAAHEK